MFNINGGLRVAFFFCFKLGTIPTLAVTTVLGALYVLVAQNR